MNDTAAGPTSGPSPKVAVIYYSATGNVHALAEAVREGAEKAGGEVRVRKVAELAPEEAIRRNEAWAAHVRATEDVTQASKDDLLWADAVIFGTPTRYGLPAAQLKQFLDTTGGLWEQGLLADKVYAAFTSSATRHGGQESTLLALSNTFYHWGGYIVPPGYTDPVQFEAGNPYGVGHVSDDGATPVGDVESSAAAYLGRRVTTVTKRLLAGAAAA
ncbi:NAD(P)H dehydrogenase (quinone) [Geodermatophilus amargosae]|uniref:NAD(P)H dehydrogenase (Quinone) n=1 Tax=Geodermatophilus amargosae TaxID=1296565 RepID=A0A1I7C0T9_9ACTN|nr:NAD(P)H:quinone oxidoreductase [Geodermatophilus amargosae]SFT92998.1 NAD(P)H dehydrogenase (quinone) [Geodermatophilus amargosae]